MSFKYSRRAFLSSLVGLALSAGAPGAWAGEQAPKTAGDAGIDWVKIPAGDFKMGDGKPRKVKITAFEMAKTLVTNKQYAACVAAGACTKPDECGNQSGGDDRPVVCVDWEQADQFAKWAGGRLPSEAEWEYAARSGGKDRKYPWGDDAPTCDKAVLSSGCGRHTSWPVCSRPAGNTEQGLCDMAGNAWQWVQDWHSPSYDGAPTDGTARVSPAGAKRVFRGGSWSSIAVDVRTATRDQGDPALRICDLGFRVVRGGRASPEGASASDHAGKAPARGGAKAPEWVAKGNGAFKDGGARAFFSVGRAPSATAADEKSRAEIASVVQGYTASFTKGYLAVTPADADFGQGESLSQHVGQTLTNFARFTRHEVKVVEKWTDPSDGTVYSLSKLDMKSFIKRLESSKELDPQVREYLMANAEKGFDDLVAARP